MHMACSKITSHLIFLKLQQLQFNNYQDFSDSSDMFNIKVSKYFYKAPSKMFANLITKFLNNIQNDSLVAVDE